MKPIEWPWKNPVMVKEIRTRMRGNRAFLLVTIHLVLLSIVVGLAYYLLMTSMSNIGLVQQRVYLGKAVFGLVVWIELVTVSFIAPALTSGAISTERERQTYDLLRVTLLPARSLVLGKYASGVIFIFLLLFTSIPMQSPAFLIGGVTPQEIIISILILSVSAIALCAIGVFFSAFLSRTMVSTVLSFAVATFLVFGIPVISSVILLTFTKSLTGVANDFNPISLSILVFAGWLMVSLTPLATIIGTEVGLLQQHSLFLTNIQITDKVNVIVLSPWIPHVAIYLVLSLLLLWISIQRIKQVER